MRKPNKHSKKSRSKHHKLKIKSKLFILGIQLAHSIGGFMGGYIYTQINILSEHITRYYEWTEDEKTFKFVVLSYTFVLGSTIGAIISPFLLGRGRIFVFKCYSVAVIATSALTVMIKAESVLFISKCIQGMFFGIYTIVYGIYNKEMCPPYMVGTGMAIN